MHSRDSKWMVKCVCTRSHYCVSDCLFLCAGAQGCSQSRAAVAAYSRINVAVRRLGALLHGHGLHLHHPQLPAGRHRRQHLSTNAQVQLIVKNNFLSKFCLKKNKNKLELNN